MKLRQDYRRDHYIVEAFGGIDAIVEVGKLAAEINAAPCPFCGGDAVAALGQIYGGPAARIECDRCHIATLWRGNSWDYLEAKELTLADTMQRSAQDWNKREAAETDQARVRSARAAQKARAEV